MRYFFSFSTLDHKSDLSASPYCQPLYIRKALRHPCFLHDQVIDRLGINAELLNQHTIYPLSVHTAGGGLPLHQVSPPSTRLRIEFSLTIFSTVFA